MKKDSTPPPVSLTTCWDKGKWHYDAESFPRNLPNSAGWAHIVAALHFLDNRGQLTAEGREELAHPDDEIALLSEHIKAGARAFLDQNYEAYLTAMKGYDQPPALQVLEAAWPAYTAKYDLSQKPRPNAYQRLLLDYAYDRSANALLRVLDSAPNLAARLRNALPDVPPADRALIEAVLTARERDPVGLAASSPDPRTLLHALRYLDGPRYTLLRLQAACVLADRLRIGNTENSDLVSLIHAVNLRETPEAESAWRALTENQKHRLASAVNLLFAGRRETHLALCAMRTVGDAASLDLIEKSVGDKSEGVTHYSAGRSEPSWDPIRRRARESTRRRWGIQDPSVGK